MKNRDDSYLIGNKFAKKKSDQPKPTGEWTPQAIEYKKWKHDLELLADAHDIVCNQLRKQLDAERTAQAHDDRKHWEARVYGLERQLAAEREKVQTYEGALIKIANDPNCDRCQVAVDALVKVAK